MSQTTPLLPTTGVYGGLAAANTINAGFDTLNTAWLGASAPSDAPNGIPKAGMLWIDSSVTNRLIEKRYDGTNWLLTGNVYDSNLHLIYRRVGGGRNSIASASTCDLGSMNESGLTITGTTSISSFGTSAQIGELKFLTLGGAITLTYNATSMILPGGANIVGAANDTLIAEPLGSGNWRVLSYATAAPAAAASVKQIQPITGSVASNALTVSASALGLDFRSTTLGSGTVTTVTGTPASLVVPSGATLGTVNGQQSRIVVIALNNAGTIELAVVNLAGGNDLSETGLISTTAITSGAASSNVFYSTTARTNVAYRVLGYVESTQATAGTWATSPSTVQGSGGQAFNALSSMGYGQSWQNLTGSRALSTTYYNTTGKAIQAMVNPGSHNSGSVSIVVAGSTIGTFTADATSLQFPLSFMIPPGASYSVTSSGSLTSWWECR